MNARQYAKRNLIALDENGLYYIRHVMAMTAEDLHSKSDIAAELAFRDEMIDELKSRLEQINEIIFSVGAPIGTDTYFKIRELATSGMIKKPHED